jgi:hypothetical protein
VREILPGLFHWTAVHPKIQIEVSSYWWREGRVLLDPLLPAEGVGAFHGTDPEHVILTNRHHWRHCGELVKALGCTVWCNAEGLHEFTHGEPVRGFRAGEKLPGGIESHPVGVICPDETALWLPVAGGALAVADGVVRDHGGPLSFVPDALLGDDPAAVKRGLREVYAGLCRRLTFDALLLAHGLPIVRGGCDALAAFARDAR